MKSVSKIIVGSLLLWLVWTSIHTKESVQIPLQNNHLRAQAEQKHAYAFFATSDMHANAVASVARRIRTLGSSAEQVVFVNGISTQKIHGLQSEGLVVRHVKSIPLTANGYYRNVAIKYEAFRMFEYDRVILLDADQWIERSIDHLFQLPPVRLAAPIASWENEPCITSAMLIIRPNLEIWAKISALIDTYARRGKGDMDLINAVFEHKIPGTGRILPEVLVLPSIYATLSTEFTYPEPHNDNPQKLWDEVLVFHFSGKHGKPYAPINKESMNKNTKRLFDKYTEYYRSI